MSRWHQKFGPRCSNTPNGTITERSAGMLTVEKRESEADSRIERVISRHTLAVRFVHRWPNVECLDCVAVLPFFLCSTSRFELIWKHAARSDVFLLGCGSTKPPMRRPAISRLLQLADGITGTATKESGQGATAKLW